MLRLVSYRLHTAKHAATQIGLFFPKPASPLSSSEGAIVNIQEILRDAPQDMNHLIENHKEIIPSLLSFAQSNKFSEGKVQILQRSEVSLLSPIPLPRRNVMCVGKNYKDHIAEVAKADKSHGIGTTSSPAVELPKYPQFFTKAPNSVIGPEEKIESHAEITKWLDYEVELAVVIGKKGRDLTADNAKDHIFGFSVANDVTARDIQRHHGQWFKGKTLDATCPLGPWIVYNDGSFDAQSIDVRLWVNGERRQQSNTSNMIFNISDILVHLSKGFTLQPGDIILTGTPDGVGYAMKPPKVLSRGDSVKLEIDKVGILENSVY
eukprot:gene1731-1837_t